MITPTDQNIYYQIVTFFFSILNIIIKHRKLQQWPINRPKYKPLSESPQRQELKAQKEKNSRSKNIIDQTQHVIFTCCNHNTGVTRGDR